MAYVLVIDDSELVLGMLEMVVKQAGHETATAASWDEAKKSWDHRVPDIVITDLNLPDRSDPVGTIMALGDVPIIIVSGRPQAELDEIAAVQNLAGAVSKDAGMMGMASQLPALIAAALP